MTEHSAHDLGRSYDCRTPGCTGTAKSATGMYAYLCDTHAAEKKNSSGPRKSPTAGTTGGGFMADLARLKQLARQADKTRATAEDLVGKALVAKKTADTAGDDYQRALREALAGQ
jgi:hypothetical protein